MECFLDLFLPVVQKGRFSTYCFPIQPYTFIQPRYIFYREARRKAQKETNAGIILSQSSVNACCSSQLQLDISQILLSRQWHQLLGLQHEGILVALTAIVQSQTHSSFSFSWILNSVAESQTLTSKHLQKTSLTSTVSRDLRLGELTNTDCIF